MADTWASSKGRFGTRASTPSGAAAPEAAGARGARNRQLARHAGEGAAGTGPPLRAAGHRGVPTFGEARPPLQQRRAALGPGSSGPAAPAHGRAGAGRPDRRADADDRRSDHAPDRL